MSQTRAYPHIRLSESDVLVTYERHDFSDQSTSALDVTKTYKYTLTVRPRAGESWETLLGKIGAQTAELQIDWFSGPPRSVLYRRRLLTERIEHTRSDLLVKGTIHVEGYKHTANARMVPQIVVRASQLNESLHPPVDAIVWKDRGERIAVFGVGGFFPVKFVNTEGNRTNSGPGKFEFNSYSGYSILIYNSHLPERMRGCGVGTHGAVARILEDVIRDAYRRNNNEDTDELEKDIVGQYLTATWGGLTPESLLAKEKTASGTNELAQNGLRNWCWGLAAELADKEARLPAKEFSQEEEVL